MIWLLWFDSHTILSIELDYNLLDRILQIDSLTDLILYLHLIGYIIMHLPHYPESGSSGLLSNEIGDWQ